MTVTGFAAQRFNSFFDDDGQHDERVNPISPPPTQKRVQGQPTKKNCRKITWRSLWEVIKPHRTIPHCGLGDDKFWLRGIVFQFVA